MQLPKRRINASTYRREPPSTTFQGTPHDDWHVRDQSESAWSQGAVRSGLMGNGQFAIDVAEPGVYTFELRRWPDNVDKPLEAKHAKISVGKVEDEREVAADDTNVVFDLKLPGGPAMLQTWLTLPNGKTRGAYYVYVSQKE